MDHLGASISNVVFHEGELALQENAGSRERLAEIAPQLIRPVLTEQRQAFFARLPFVVLGGVDDTGQAWATLLAGRPGFVQSPEVKRLVVRARPPIDDPLASLLVSGAQIGLLGIEAHARRRNRVNGRVVHVDDASFELAVNQSFGNCPKYIHPRQAEFLADVMPAGSVSRCTGLDEIARQMIRKADTFFVASAHPGVRGESCPHQGVDVSHRGGAPGFVELADNDTLVVPDYVGNAYFNTLGNLLLNPRAGLLFVDFDVGRLLWLAAEAEIVQDGPDLARIPAAERLLRLKVSESRYTPGPLPLRWKTQPRSAR